MAKRTKPIRRKSLASPRLVDESKRIDLTDRGDLRQPIAVYGEDNKGEAEKVQPRGGDEAVLYPESTL
jgi:hypothetical protein